MSTSERDADELHLLLAKLWGEYSSAKVADAILAAGYHKDGKSMMEAVREFHSAFHLPIAAEPKDCVANDLADLRIALLREEFEEYLDDVELEDVVDIADALGDIVYIAYGTAITYGIDLDAVLREIHKSNMSKLGPDGKPILREDGKVLKGEGYRAPDLRWLKETT
jgi:predicted HAD superfamily Cof-like phosphohydrolase